jgi:hypothetical protein
MIQIEVQGRTYLLEELVHVTLRDVHGEGLVFVIFIPLRL